MSLGITVGPIVAKVCWYQRPRDGLRTVDSLTLVLDLLEFDRFGFGVDLHKLDP